MVKETLLHLYLTQNNCNGCKGKVQKKKIAPKKVPKIASNIAKLDLTNGNFDLDKIQLRIVHCASELLRYLHTNSIPSKFQSKMHYCQTMQSKRPKPHSTMIYYPFWRCIYSPAMLCKESSNSTGKYFVFNVHILQFAVEFMTKYFDEVIDP